MPRKVNSNVHVDKTETKRCMLDFLTFNTAVCSNHYREVSYDTVSRFSQWKNYHPG
jgi:hypothetical protein